MKPASRALPGGGFVLVAATLLGAALFLGWGLATPPLDTAWRLQVELEVGERGPLTEREFAVLQATLLRHPALADALLDGAGAGLVGANAGGAVDVDHAYLVRRSAGEPGLLEVASERGEPIAVAARTRDASRGGPSGPGAAFTWLLPGDGPFPQLVEVRIGDGRGPPRKRPEKSPETVPAGARPPRTPPVRVRLGKAP